MTGREHMLATIQEGGVLRRGPSQVLRLFTMVVALVAGLAIALGAMLSAAQAASEGKEGKLDLDQFRVPTDNSQPRYIAEGSDGNLWFTEGNEIFTPNPDPATGGTFHRNIGRITPAGEITEFRIEGRDPDNPLPTQCDCLLNDIVQGPDGVLYFTTNSNSLGRITTKEGTVQPFIETPFPVGGALARHGNDLWINDFNAHSIWRYNIPNGAFTEFPISNLGPSSVAVDADGIVWFADAVVVDPSSPAQGVIGRLDPADGSVTTFNVDGLPQDVSIATDGAVWFTERFTPQGVGRLDPATGASTVFAVDGGPEEIAPAAGGSMWFTRTTAGNIARISPDGAITAQSKAVKDSEPFGITVASNPNADPTGNPWFTMMSANKIATFQLR
jgi:virginiamycin B lyase